MNRPTAVAQYLQEMKKVPLEKRMQLLEDDALATVHLAIHCRDRKALPFLAHNLTGAKLILDRRIAPIIKQEVVQEVNQTVNIIKRKYPTTKPSAPRKVKKVRKPKKPRKGKA